MPERDVYIAIADPTRRQILDLLYDHGPLLAGQIAERFSAASRPGISRHLRVLRECGVVSARRDGKTQNYEIELEPLLQLKDGWLGKFGDMQKDSLKALRERVEG